MKQKIIDEALKLFLLEGVDFKLIDLATNLGISKKTLYKFFNNKEDLLMHCVDYLFLYVHKEQTRIFNDTSLDELTRLKKLILAMPKEFNSINVNFLSDLKKEYPLVAECIMHHLENDWDETFALIDLCKEKKQIKNINNQLFRMMYLACNEKILDINCSDVKYEELQEQILDILIGGMKNA